MFINTFINIILNALSVNQNYGGNEQAGHIAVLLRSLTHLTLTYPGFVEEENHDILRHPMQEIRDLVLNTKRLGSVGSSVELFLRAIKSVRDQWNPEVGRALDLIEGSLFKIKNYKKEPVEVLSVQKHLDKLYSRMFTFYGTVSETMARDNAFYLLKCGKLIERILSRVSVIRSGFVFRHPDYIENELLEALLNYHHLLYRYRNTYRLQIGLAPVLDMVLLEASSPYSLVYLLDLLTFYLDKLPTMSSNDRLNQAQKLVLDATAKIKLADVPSLCQYDPDTSYRASLDTLMADITSLMLSASESLSNLYFNHVAIQPSLFGEFTQPGEDEI